MHRVLGVHPRIGCDRLALIRFSYVGFDTALHDDGEIVVMDAAARQVRRIFETLRNMRFPIAKARLLNIYNGDDDASMADNNTSAFNDRPISPGGTISLHAYGLAIDVNPVQNPVVERSGARLTFRPAEGVKFANRSNDRPGKDFRSGMTEMIIDVFADNGFLIWGGYWDEPIDYQHFQVGRKTAEHLASVSPTEAAEIFDRMVASYHACRRSLMRKGESSRTPCLSTADLSP